MLLLKKFAQTINSITHFLKWVAYIATFAMMLLVTLATTLRNFNIPIVGDYEMVQVLMVCVILFSLPYVQYKGEHVSVTLLLDRFPKKIRSVFDNVIYFIIFLVCLILSYIIFLQTYHEYIGHRNSSDLLYIPFYPFKFGMSLAFLLWGLESLLSLFKSIGITNEDLKEN